mmetsp:Transcript_25862/g.40488  ORF Transcript_25862/g.40488 Transcript_25862/m.40488 type:complete len:84 (+) Transcript_25862:598-849(+)
MITTDMRFNLFCKAIKSDPSQGLSLDGLIGLYARPDQQGKVSPVLRGNFLAVTSCFIVCVILSIPYYLPSCTEYCRKLPFIQY